MEDIQAEPVAGGRGTETGAKIAVNILDLRMFSGLLGTMNATVARMPINPTNDMTAADFRKLPEGPPYHELIDGELILQESPTTGHQNALGELFLALGNWAKRARLGRALLSPLDVYLNDRNVFHPDILFISNRRLAILQPDGVYGAPDLVVEILSPSTAWIDRGRKREVYAESGLREFWTLDVRRRMLAVYRLDKMPEKPARTLEGSAVLTSPILKGFETELSSLFEE